MSRPTRPPTYLCWCPARPDGYGSSTCGGATPADAAANYARAAAASSGRITSASAAPEVIHVRSPDRSVTVVRVRVEVSRRYWPEIVEVLEGGAP